ncbi:MAG: adenosylcobinamide amidohydrolase [Nitrospira sp.]|nr:adenosylcobinamide amidohydrolase [Nitrospira sp.]
MDEIVTGPVCTGHRVIDRTLIIDLGGRRRVLSSAPQGGGVRLASYVLNHQVDGHNVASNGRPRRFGDPARCLRRLAARYGLRGATVGLMTAVPMTQLVTTRYAAGSLWVECFATVGVANAVRVGEGGTIPVTWRVEANPVVPGTINLILVTNGCLSPAAMVGAVQVATEAKTAVLLETGVPSILSGGSATGTGTDVVVIACRLRGEGPFHRYSGTHTILGTLIGQTVTHCVSAGLRKATLWKETRRKRSVGRFRDLH